MQTAFLRRRTGEGRTIRGNAAGRTWEGRVGECWSWEDNERAENEKHEHTNDFE